MESHKNLLHGVGLCFFVWVPCVCCRDIDGLVGGIYAKPFGCNNARFHFMETSLFAAILFSASACASVARFTFTIEMNDYAGPSKPDLEVCGRIPIGKGHLWAGVTVVSTLKILGATPAISKNKRHRMLPTEGCLASRVVGEHSPCSYTSTPTRYHLFRARPCGRSMTSEVSLVFKPGHASEA